MYVCICICSAYKYVVCIYITYTYINLFYNAHMYFSYIFSFYCYCQNQIPWVCQHTWPRNMLLILNLRLRLVCYYYDVIIMLLMQVHRLEIGFIFSFLMMAAQIDQLNLLILLPCMKDRCILSKDWGLAQETVPQVSHRSHYNNYEDYNNQNSPCDECLH